MNLERLINEISKMSEEEREVYYRNLEHNGIDDEFIQSIKEKVLKKLNPEPAEIQLDDDVPGLVVEATQPHESVIDDDFDI